MSAETIALPAGDGPVGRVWKIDEVAAYLRIGKRTLSTIIKENFDHTLNLRKYLFSDADVTTLWELVRCRLNSTGARALGTSTSAGPSAERAYTRALALTTPKSRKRSASNARRSS